MASDSTFIERKAIDVSGRLGSLYDASTDNLINQHSVQATETYLQNKSSICRIFSGKESTDTITYLEEMDFNDDLQQSIILGTVETSGVSSLIKHSQPIQGDIRFLYYSYRSKEEELDVTTGNIDQIISPPSSSTNATHMITKIIWGFEVLCVIPIPDHKSADEIDSLLRSIASRLVNTETEFIPTDNEKRQTKQLIHVTVYGSETCLDIHSTSLLTIFDRILAWQNNVNFHHPLIYTMRSLRQIYGREQFSEACKLLDQNNSDVAKIKTLITSLNKWIKRFHRSFKTFPKDFSSQTLDQVLEDVQQQFDLWSTTYKDFREHLKKVFVDVRRGRCRSTIISNVISDQRYSSLQKTEIDAFNEKIQQLLEKAILIKRLNEDQIQYMNVMDVRIGKKLPKTFVNIDAALQQMHFEENQYLIIWYSNDRLKHADTDIWDLMYRNLILERKQSTKTVTLIYADFSQCQQNLEDFIIKRLPKQSISEPQFNHPRVKKLEQPLQSTSASESQPRSSGSAPLPKTPSQVTEINVLLLGETGVGKSTFINAFVNYLMFDTLQQAERDEPIVIIPVSFLTTVGDQFEEFMVEFGDADSNEDHKHPGESVTQHCKSHVFNLNERFRLRLIDTPGMGDTRGVDQDVKNIDHILTYVNNLSHLNAICLLLKPNASRLNIFFRSCVNQLLTYLTPIGYDNLIFCFTNARSTFFAPGDTGPLLRQMLKQEHLDGIPFGKTNTFCFDSESFRYLAATQRGINFGEPQERQCIRSWITSMNESVRLLNFIQKRKPYSLNEWHSPKKVALEISMLARPLMETLRLILYNWKLRKTGNVTKQIRLNLNLVAMEICTNCAQSDIVPMGPLWIVTYGSDKNKSNKRCRCSSNEKHFLIEYTVQHELVAQPVDHSIDEFENSFHDFLYKCDRLSHFLQQKGLSDRGDPFTSVLERFLDEERLISDTTKIKSNMNRELNEVLRSLSQIRQRNRNKLNESNERLSMDQIDQIINELKSKSDVKNQIECIKTSRQLKMQANEHQVEIPSIKNKIFAELANSLA